MYMMIQVCRDDSGVVHAVKSIDFDAAKVVFFCPLERENGLVVETRSYRNVRRETRLEEVEVVTDGVTTIEEKRVANFCVECFQAFDLEASGVEGV